LGSEIQDPENNYFGSGFPDLGSRGQKGTGSRIRNTGSEAGHHPLCQQ
jgi:hypothetical protein